MHGHAGPRLPLVLFALALLLGAQASGQSLSRNPHPRPPSPPAAPRGEFCGPTLITESVSQDIISGNSVACADMGSGFTFETHYARAFDLPSFGIDGFFQVCEVDVAVEAALSLAGTQPLTVYLYSTPLGTFPGGLLTPIGTAVVPLPDQDQSYVTVPVDGIVPPQSTLVVDVASEDGTVALSAFYIGSNGLGQTAPGYITAPDCGFATPTDLADAGFPNMHMVINVSGTGFDTGTVPPPPPECPITSSFFSNTTPTAITDNGTTTSTIDVSGAGSYIWDVNMLTNIRHTFPDDLDITLTSPQGTVVTITTDNGGANDDVFNGTVWDDQANPGGQLPYTANDGLVTDQTYANLVTASPLVPEEAFGAFIGEDPNGTWTLTISDDSAADTGTLDAWLLAITTLASAPPVSWEGFWPNSTPVPIADNAVTTSVISVPPGGGTRICRLRATTDITHTSAADLDITLTSPQGTVVTLTTDNGGANDDVFAGTTWDDKANPGGQVPYTTNDGLVTDQAYVDGTTAAFLVPEEALAAFNGEDPTGDWTLTISDDAAGEVGMLNSWAVRVTTCSCAVGAPDAPLRVDAHAASLPASRPSGSSNLNEVLELGETVEVEPSWGNEGTVPFDFYGFGSNLTGPPGPTYNLVDDYAGYGTINPAGTANCFDTTGDCFVVEITGPRPAQHFDASFDENGAPIASPTGVGTYSKTWTLHVGESFPDVPTANQFYRFIETIFHNGVTGGCGGSNYCPDSTVTRAQMAVFLLKSKLGSSYAPPPCTGMVFGDVPCTGGIFDPWIEDLAGRGITGGCGGGNYCPGNPVTRAQMAVFLLKTLLGSGYTPPACTGTVFLDVPCTGGIFDPWIEDLAGRSITGGCGGGNYCPGSPNTRGQMAVFLTKTFNLLLYGP
jgi:subtilisin-like proprotein convertase family protein